MADPLGAAGISVGGNEIFLAIGVMFGLMFGYMFSYILDPYNRAKLFRVVMKKNYGVVEIVSKGGVMLRKAVDLGSATANQIGIGKRIFTLNPMTYYYHSGIPTVYFNEEDTDAISLDKKTTVPMRSPELLHNVLMLQKDLAAAKALLEDKNMKYMLMGACLGAAIAAVTGLMIYNAFTTELMPLVKACVATATAAKAVPTV